MGVLHGINASPFVRKVRVALAEKGISYEHDPVIPFGVSAEYKAMSPLGKVPCYTTDNGVHIPDSSVIIQYLERVKPEPALIPSDPEDAARALFFEEYGDSALVAATGTVFFQRIVGPRMMGQQTDEAAVTQALSETIPPLFAWLDSQIGASDYLVGDAFSVADIGITSPMVNLRHAGETIDANKYPKLAGYVAKMMERPSFKALIDEEAPQFSVAA